MKFQIQIWDVSKGYPSWIPRFDPQASFFDAAELVKAMKYAFGTYRIIHLPEEADEHEAFRDRTAITF